MDPVFENEFEIFEEMLIDLIVFLVGNSFRFNIDSLA